MANNIEAFNEYKKNKAEAGFAKRKARLDAIKSKKDALQWIAETKTWFKKIVGELVKVENQKKEYHGFIQAQGYRIEKWLFESLPGTFTSANLYVPEKISNSGISIVAPIGHWFEGKALLDYQNLGAYMACHGVPVLVYEHVGHGERREYWDTIKQESLPGKSPSTEHSRLGNYMIAAGILPSNFIHSELNQAIEFLKSFDYIKSDKIGITGTSGGGSISSQAASLFENLAFSIPVCSLGKEVVGNSSCHCQIMWTEGVEGISAIDNLICSTSKKVMVVTEHLDNGLDATYGTLRKIFDLLEVPKSSTDFFKIHDMHGYTHPMIEAVYRYLQINFDLPQQNFNSWQRIKNYKEADLNITKSGFLNRERFQVSMIQHVFNNCVKKGNITPTILKNLIGFDQLRDVVGTSNAECLPEMSIGSSLNEEKGVIGLVDWVPVQAGWYHGYGNVYNSAEADAGHWSVSFGCSVIGYRALEILNFIGKNKGKIKTLKAEGKWCLPLLVASIICESKDFPKIELHYLLSSFRSAISEDLNLLYTANYIPSILQYGDIDDLLKLGGAIVSVKFRTDSFGRVIAN
jgi:hypothetical protein